jgi:hypothetical protein
MPAAAGMTLSLINDFNNTLSFSIIPLLRNEENNDVSAILRGLKIKVAGKDSCHRSLSFKIIKNPAGRFGCRA